MPTRPASSRCDRRAATRCSFRPVPSRPRDDTTRGRGRRRRDRGDRGRPSMRGTVSMHGRRTLTPRLVEKPCGEHSHCSIASNCRALTPGARRVDADPALGCSDKLSPQDLGRTRAGFRSVEQRECWAGAWAVSSADGTPVRRAPRTRGKRRAGHGHRGAATSPPAWPAGSAWNARGEPLVLEQQLAVLRQRPEVVGDERLELVDDLAQRVLGRDDRRRRRPSPRRGPSPPRAPRAGRARARRSRRRASRRGRRPSRRSRLMPRDDGAPPSSPRYRATAGRIIVEAMSTAQFASMFETLT